MSVNIITTSDSERWERYLQAIPGGQLVHTPRYTRLYERYGDGTGECFVYEAAEGIALYPYLRRPIEGAPGYSDIITPYGYGGAIYECRGKLSPEKLVKKFRRAFASYVMETKTVTEFVRFHPLLGNHEYFSGLMDEVILQCANAVMDLSVGPSVLFRQYRTSYQQCIRKAKGSGLRVELLPAPGFIQPFFDLYAASMARKHQEGYVRFRREYFDYLSSALGTNVLCFAVMQAEKIVSIALFLTQRNFIDYFLCASDPEKLTLRPNHLLLHEVALWAIARGISTFHLGGGHLSLQFFKHGFANVSRNYYVGKHVFDRELYGELSREHWSRHDQVWRPDHPWFPGYRAEFVS